jgi:hypothetical protein
MSSIERDSYGKTEMAAELELLATLQRDIAKRLRPVCAQMSEDAFDELVRDIAAMKLKYGADSDLSGSLRVELNALVDDGESPT